MPDAMLSDQPHLFLHDVARCLALISKRGLKGTPGGLLTPFSRARLTPQLSLSSFVCSSCAPGSPAQIFVPLLLGRAGLVGAAQDHLRLSAAAHEWLALPKPRQLSALRDVWFADADLSWPWLAPGRLRRSLRGHWHGVVLEVLAEILAIPPGEWTPCSAVVERLAGRRALDVRRPIRGPQPAPGSIDLLGRQLACFLMQQLLPSLGLVETAGSAMAPLIFPTDEGAAWLRARLARSNRSAPEARTLPGQKSPPLLRFPPEAEPALALMPGTPSPGDMALELTIPSSAPALCTFEVAHFTELISLGPPARYRLTRQSLEQALEWGYSAADVHLLLGRLGGQPLPAGVSAALHGWRDTIAIIESEPGYRLRASGAGVLAGLRKRRPFRQRTSLLASRADAWVPAACAHELFRYLRRVGYQVKESRLPPFPAVQNGPRPSGLPLASLLVVLRTYRQLRELIPGLAVLDELREVEGESAAALIPDDLAVVERLVESHRIFLRHHLKRDPGEEAEEEATEQTAEARAEGRPAAGRDAPAAGAGTPALPGPQVLEAALQAAIAADRRLEITYADTQGHCTHRTVRPLHLEERWGNAYLLAFCELRQDERHFRLDRIVEARPV